MRDIRSDLQERATLIDVQIRAAYSHFEKTVEQLKNEHNVRVADLKSGLTMIAKFIEFEQRYFRPDSPPVHRPDSPPVQSSALVTLADLFMHRLNEGGPMSREELVALAVKEGFFADTETAAQAVHPMLVILSRSELERQIYGWNEEVESNAIEFLIHTIRKKLGATVIRNVRGVGWMVDRPS